MSEAALISVSAWDDLTSRGWTAVEPCTLMGANARKICRGSNNPPDSQTIPQGVPVQVMISYPESGSKL